MSPRTHIYIAEDNRDDRDLMEHCLRGEKLATVRFFQDGEELMDHCEDHDTLCFLLLLDLKMPRVDGFDVLKWLKGAKKLQCNPVIVLSSSQEPRDIRKAYELGANAYIQKPLNLEGYQTLVRCVREFWVDLNKSAPASHR